MPIRYTFLDKVGNPLADGTKLTPVQAAFQVLCEGGLGVPILDRSTLDEFVRRADLFQAYVGVLWRNGDGTPRIFNRADWVELLPGVRSNWTKSSKADFDRNMKKMAAEYWEAIDRKRGEAKG